MILILLAFICLGFLIGNLVGMTSESTIAVLIPLLFTFAGGSAVAFLPKLEEAARQVAAGAVIALSVSCLAGVYGGIVISERQLLSPPNIRHNVLTSPTKREDRKYLRDLSLDQVDAIDQRYRNRELTADQAYEQLYQSVTRGGSQ